MKKSFQSALAFLLVLVLLTQMIPASAVRAWAEDASGISFPAKEEEDATPVLPEGELLEKREESVKHFRMSDGSFLAASYPTAVHFEEEGEWIEIDNRLEETELGNLFPSFVEELGVSGMSEVLPKAEEPVYHNQRNRFSVMLPVVLNEESWFGISDKGHSLFFRMEGVQESESVAEKEEPLPEDPLARACWVPYNSSVRYPHALPGAELKYDIRGQALKETVIFSEPDAVPELLSYRILATDMSAEVDENGEIRFFAEGEVVFVLPSPFLLDSEGNSAGLLSVELEELGDGGFILRYLPERAWLEAEERCWPVVMDPVITNMVDTNYIRDTYICRGYPTSNYGSAYYFYSGHYSNPGKAARALISHSQLPSLGSGDMIVASYLVAYGRSSNTDGQSTQVDAHAITGSWDSQYVTWNWDVHYESDVLDFQIVNSTADKCYTWNVTSAVQRWYGGAASKKGALTNHGVMLISPSEETWDGPLAMFHSSDSSPSSYWPMLYISYRNATGLESYWDYTSADAGRAGIVYANNYTGNLAVSRIDMSYSGNRMPTSIAFTYNQNDCSTNIGYGKGWRSAYSQRIEQLSISGIAYYRWTDGDGTRIYFRYDDEESAWIDENGLGYKLNPGAAGCTITDRDENSLVFDANGRLISVADKMSNTLSITYMESGTANLRISQISDGAGRVYSFSYSSNLLSSVVYMGAGNTGIETVSYSYDGESLSAVTYTDGKSAGYSYASDKLTEARDIQRNNGSRNKLIISYGGTPARVMEISYYDGSTTVNSVSLRYGDHCTTVTDNVGRWCAYEFNNTGNTVSVYNQAGQALYGSFATDESPAGRANQLIHSSRLQDTVVNLLDSRSETGAWSETLTVESGALYSLSGVVAAGEALSMTAGIETKSVSSISSTERTELTITIPAGVTSLTISGTASAQALQLEQTEAASRYNLLLNTDMSSAAAWVGSSLGNDDGIVSLTDTWDAFNVRLNDSVLKLTGSGTAAKSYSQTIPVSGSLGDDYSFGGWVKSGSVPLSNKNDPYSTLERHCGIRVRLLNGSTEVDSKIVDANTDCPEWQFLSGSVRASGAYDSVEFSFVYDYNANSSSFDGAQLFREKFAYVYHYDEEGRIDKVTDLEGRETSYSYRGTSSDITLIGLPGGAEYSYSYSNNGLLQSAISDTGITSTYSYDAFGNPTGTSITGSGEKSLESSMSYTADGNMPASVTGSDANTVSYTNDSDRSLVLSVTDPANVTTVNSFDVLRRPVSSQIGDSFVNNTYCDDLLVGLSHSNTANTSTEYSLGYTTADLLSTVQVGSVYTLVENSYQPGTWTLARQDYGNGAGWAYSYNEFDQVTARWTTNGIAGVEFRYFYNSEGALARVEQYATTLSDGAIMSRDLCHTERYYYDSGDRLIRVWETDADGHEHVFRWTYDSNDQITELTETIGGMSWTYTNSYNGDQQPTLSSYGGNVKSFVYDGIGRLRQTVLSRNNNPVLTTYYTFRNLDSTRTTTQVKELFNLFGSSFDAYGYEYDARGNISSVSFPWNAIVLGPLPTPEPDPFPTPTPEPTPPHWGGGHGFDPDNPILNPIQTPNPTQPPDADPDDLIGNLEGVVTIYYEYDALNELVWEKSEIEERAWKYSYDRGGNLLARTEYSFYDGVVGFFPLSTVTYTYGDASWPDLLTAYDGAPITYDAIGNPLSYRGWSFAWQGGRQLAAASDGTTSLSFQYNESGLRTEKTVGSNTHRYVYRGSSLAAEITEDYALYFHYDANGTASGFTYVSGNTTLEYFYRRDLQGDVIGIVAINGASAADYRYDAWGRLLEASGPMAEINPIRYRGYYYDAETELYYLHSRYYDPEVGRFINADSFASTGQGILDANMFAYCGNEPVSCRDSSGTKKDARFSKDIEDNEELARRSVQLLIQSKNAILDTKHIVLDIDISELIGKLGTYWELKQLTRGTGLEVHHLIEKRFLRVPEIGAMYSSQYSMPSVVLDPGTHGGYTSAWRVKYAYGITDYGSLNYADVFEFSIGLYSGGGHDDWIEYIFN